ncbi:hypothetical protein GCM10023147_39550 [Tsukamurella soli]|uniref:UspA domain-containing protein n=1 Tax=Tsukamurella soli TaxID=644556 RepID=A0ABP8K558_9ACTN
MPDHTARSGEDGGTDGGGAGAPAVEMDRSGSVFVDHTSERYTPGDPNLVVGWNGDPSSVAALRFAADLAERIRARVDVVHIHDFADTPMDPDSGDWEELVDQRLDDLARAAKEQLLGAVTAGWTYHVARGESPSKLLLRVAGEVGAYAVVLGSPHSGLLGVLDEFFGNRFARGVIAHNHTVPIVLVPVEPTGERS